jgi:hypothetical protein
MNVAPMTMQRTPLPQRKPLKRALRILRTEGNESRPFKLIAPPLQGVLLSVANGCSYIPQDNPARPPSGSAFVRFSARGLSYGGISADFQNWNGTDRSDTVELTNPVEGSLFWVTP